MDRSPRVLVVAALAVTIVLWASAFVAIRVLLPALGAGGVASARLALAAVAFGVIALWRACGSPRARSCPGSSCSAPPATAARALLVGAAALVYALWIVLQKRALRTMGPIQVTAWGHVVRRADRAAVRAWAAARARTAVVG
jgi:hypothetical protein